MLRVGPVDRTDDKSSYQCGFALLNGVIESSIGTLTVLGKLDSSIDQSVNAQVHTTMFCD